jgi:hypothetical protein
MLIYDFPINTESFGRKFDGIPMPEAHSILQPIDLDYIVSVGPRYSTSYTGSCVGEAHANFTIFIKIGTPITITYYSGTIYDFPKELLDKFETERNKLIQAWKNKDLETE